MDTPSAAARGADRRRCDVVIATRNRPQGLARVLDGLLDQTFADFGVIVVDDCSDEPLEPIVRDERFASLDVQVITLATQSGPAAGRNTGVAASDAEFVVFLDDDVVPDRHLIEIHLAAVDPAGGAARPIVSCGPFVQPADWEDPTPWNLWEAHQAKKEADAMSLGLYDVSWRQFHTGNNCMPIAAFRAIGGFDERFKRSEDDELAMRLHQHGCEFVFEPNAIGWHYSRRTLDAWLYTPRAYAYFDHMMDQLHPESGHLATKTAELARRRLPLRLARVVLVNRRLTRWAIGAAVAASRLAHRHRRLQPVMMGALSVAYDLSYLRSLDDARHGRSELMTP
ncbi:MAG: glycosyltransferase [Acidimicrobiia bacterium]|nr:glycosyltransferase [Acidimicrobiia bacterium]